MNQKLQFYFTMILILRSSQRFSITGTEALFPKTETVTLADEITFESNKNPSPAGIITVYRNAHGTYKYMVKICQFLFSRASFKDIILLFSFIFFIHTNISF